VVATVASGPHKGAQFLGTATYAKGRVSIRFRTVLLASGAEYSVKAEARGEDGAFGFYVGGEPERDEDEPSVEAEVAKDTATDFATGALGGVGGAVVGDYVRKKRRSSRSPRSSPGATTRLEAGESLDVFIHETIRTKTK
jgi:hypothetical protein